MQRELRINSFAISFACQLGAFAVMSDDRARYCACSWIKTVEKRCKNAETREPVHHPVFYYSKYILFCVYFSSSYNISSFSCQIITMQFYKFILIEFLLLLLFERAVAEWNYHITWSTNHFEAIKVEFLFIIPSLFFFALSTFTRSLVSFLPLLRFQSSETWSSEWEMFFGVTSLGVITTTTI